MSAWAEARSGAVAARLTRRTITPLALASFAAAFYAVISIFRHDRFGSYGFDLGIFDQTIWGYSHFEILPNTVKNTHDLLGDHFHPILMALAPAYWIWDDVRVLLVVQALLLAGASLPVFFWARERLGFAAAIVFQLAFLSFWGLLAGVIFDFHELAVAVPAISVGTYALLKRRRWLFVGALVVGCLSKEDIALTFAAMGIYALVFQRRTRFGLAVTAAAGAWFGITTQVIMPAIAGHTYTYWTYDNLGSNAGRALLALAKRPYRTVTLLFDHGQKVRTLLELFGSWLFLPLFSPLVLLTIPTLAERFWSTNRSFWSTSAQYSLPLAPLLAFATIDGVSRLRARTAGHSRRFAPVVAAAVLVCGLALVIWSVRPLRGLTTYMSAHRAAEVESCLSTIPSNATVAASNQLVPHLTHRKGIYRLFVRSGQEYLAIVDDTPVGKQVLGFVRGRRPVEPENIRYAPVCARGGVTILRRSRSA
jgi:uncharacterized membrane protein